MKKYMLVLLVVLPQIAWSQSEWVVAGFRQLRTSEQRMAFLSDTHIVKIDKPTYEAILTDIEAKKDAKTLFFAHYQFIRHAGHFKSQEVFRQTIAKMLKIAKENGLKVEWVVAQFQNSLQRFAVQEISEQQVYYDYLSCFEQIKLLGFDAFKNYALDIILHEIGRNFYQLGDYDKALECLSDAEKVAIKGNHFHTLILNLIESIYANRKDFPHAIAYAQKIYEVNLNNKLSPNQDPKNWYPIFWRGLSSLDIAQYLFEMGNFEQGEAYADRGYELYKAQEDLNDMDKVVAAFDALQVLIKIKLQLGKLNEVEALFKKVETLKPRINLSEDINYFKPLRLYQNYTQYYEVKKDLINAYRYLKLATDMQDSLNRRNDKRKLWQTEMRVKADRYQAQIKSAEEESHLQERLRNIAVAALLLFVGFAFVVYRRIKKDNTIIKEQKALLETSLGEKETLLKEIHHRVKNNLQIISGLLEKQALKSHDATTRKLMKEGQNRVFSMALVHQNLYQSNNLNAIEIKFYLNMLTQHIKQSHATLEQNIQVDLKADDSTVSIDTAIPLGLILNELITNCYKYAFTGRQKGKITVIFHQNEKDLYLCVSDNGVGLPEDFDIQKTNSLGMNLVRGLVRQMNGKLKFRSNTEGAVFEINCPC
ncbi:MAG: hypothetical protein JNL70_25160 [Saprospiraceae bacterium]|nr:hypothetical protein [Saprospiraceae bacterium]